MTDGPVLSPLAVELLGTTIDELASLTSVESNRHGEYMNDPAASDCDTISDGFDGICFARRLAPRLSCGARCDASDSIIAWDFPLSTAEKRERIIALFLKDEAWGHQQVRNDKKVAKHAKRKSAKIQRRRSTARLQQSQTRWRQGAMRFRNGTVKLRQETRSLRSEVSALRLTAADLRAECERLEAEKAKLCDITHCCQSIYPSMSSVLVNEAGEAVKASVHPELIGGPQSAPHMSTSMGEALASKPAESSANRSSQTEGRMLMPFKAPLSLLSLSSQNARKEQSCSISGPEPSVAPRSIAPMMTPRGIASMMTPRDGMRGTVAVVSWSRCASVPWVAFKSRITGLDQIYGTCTHEDDVIEQGSLRRGEFVRAVSGAWRSNSGLAHSLRILTSEGQEFLAGADADANSELDSNHTGAGSICEKWAFEFEAQDGFEIVGIRVSESGHLSGVKQLPMAPPRGSRVAANG